jgi:hypothetical protein
VNPSVTSPSARGSFFTITEGKPYGRLETAPLPSASEALPGEPTWHECFTGLKAQWADMRPAARWALVGSSIASVAALGYITIRLGPIPSIRKTMRALPDLARTDNARWIRGQAAGVLSRVDRTAQRHNAYARLSAGALATTMALTNAYPVQQTPSELPAVMQSAAPQDRLIPLPPLGYQQRQSGVAFCIGMLK